MLRDPSRPQEDKVKLSSLKYFTNREKYIEAFDRLLQAKTTDELKILMFYGAGGVGKTMLSKKLCAHLEEQQPPVPHARFDLDLVGSTLQAHRSVLMHLRQTFADKFNISFTYFDLCHAVISAREKGDPPPLIRDMPITGSLVKFFTELAVAPLSVLGSPLHKILARFPGLEKTLRKIGGTEEVLRLRRLDDDKLSKELIRLFMLDLSKSLPERTDSACRGVIFFDTYEMLWRNREADGSVQAHQMDAWVRELAGWCPQIGILLVLIGRDCLRWDEYVLEEESWQPQLDLHRLGGLSRQDAQHFLARCGIGPDNDEPPTPLQQAIITCCDEDHNQEVYCHPLYLSLCAEIVLNTRNKEGRDPVPETFAAIPGDRTAATLAERFLRSLHDEKMELWVQELSLTPRFDEQAALDLDADRRHQCGRAGWKQLCRFSFVFAEGNGFYTLHKTMREVLNARVPAEDARKVHLWFRQHWQQRRPELAWVHQWQLDPQTALETWEQRHRQALDNRRIDEARELLNWWTMVAVNDSYPNIVADQLQAKALLIRGKALWATPTIPRSQTLRQAIKCYQAALNFYTKSSAPETWAKLQSYLGNAFCDLPTGTQQDNLVQAISFFQAALEVYNEHETPEDWARVQNSLGTAYSHFQSGARNENLLKAIAYFESALRIYTEHEHPADWARLQSNLGAAYCDLATEGGRDNLKKAIAYYNAALRIYTEKDAPQDWARTQSNMGNVYFKLLADDKSENIEKAITHYNAALRIYTENDFPGDWARTQNYLGDVYNLSTEGSRTVNLQTAITYYRAALRIYTEDDFPREWAKTQLALGTTSLHLAREQTSDETTTQARYHLMAAKRGFLSTGMKEEAEMTAILLQALPQ